MCINYALLSSAFSTLWNILDKQGTSGGVMVNKLDKETFTSEFGSHWVPHLYGFVPHLSKLLGKLLYWISRVIL